MEIKISVIIPVYNAESYLKRCLESIINQSYSNLEIILVNDGSQDTSGEIIDNYAANDSRIIVIHKENGGIGSAYKVAFEKMSGDYISFIDSDDYVTLNFYEEIIEQLYKHRPDIVHFGRVLFDNKEKVTDKLKRFDDIIEGNDAIFQHHYTLLKDPSLACRVFNKELFSSVTLFDQNIGIDEILIVQALAKTEKIIFIDKVYYYTFERPDSVSRIEYSENKIQQGVRIYNFICEFMQKNKPKFSSYLEIKYLIYLMSVYELSIKRKEFIRKEIIKILENDIIHYYQLSRKSINYNKLPKLLSVKVRILSYSKTLFDILLKAISFKKTVFKLVKITIKKIV